ncbi:MAG: hypothetical protein ACYCS1_11435 [Gammaproteobacteria bacterium]
MRTRMEAVLWKVLDPGMTEKLCGHSFSATGISAKGLQRDAFCP